MEPTDPLRHWPASGWIPPPTYDGLGALDGHWGRLVDARDPQKGTAHGTCHTPTPHALGHTYLGIDLGSSDLSPSPSLSISLLGLLHSWLASSETIQGALQIRKRRWHERGRGVTMHYIYVACMRAYKLTINEIRWAVLGGRGLL